MGTVGRSGLRLWNFNRVGLAFARAQAQAQAGSRCDRGCNV